MKSDAFIVALAQCGVLSHAANQVGISRSTIQFWRREHPEFEVRVRDALAEFAGSLEVEAIRRGSSGWDEPVYYQGTKVGSIRKYDSQIMIRLLEGHVPERYRQKVDIGFILKDKIQALAAKLGLDESELDAEVRKLLEDEENG